MHSPRKWVNTGLKTHGMRNSPEFRIWSGMITRCYNPNCKSWPDYGGRGISICQRWLDRFEDFYADMGPRPDKHQIDRINNDGDYEPSNCRWISKGEQARNRRSNVMVTFQGETLNLTDWAAKTGVKMFTIRARLLRGWDVERALSPVPEKGRGIPRPK